MSGLQSTDEELWERVQLGQVEAFNELFRRHWPTLYRTAFARTDSQQAAFDIVQDIFIQLWLQRETLHIKESAIQYMQGAVRNQVFNYYRTTRRENEQLKALSRFLENTHEGSPDDPDAREVALAKAVDGLPGRIKDVYILRIHHAYSFRDIGAALNIKPQTAKNAYSRAVTLLRDRLAEGVILIILLIRHR